MTLFAPLPRKNIFFFLGLFSILTILPISVFLFQKTQLLFTAAEDLEAKPTNFELASVAGETASISWTSEEVTGDLPPLPIAEKEEYIEDEVIVAFKEAAKVTLPTLQKVSPSINSMQPLGKGVGSVYKVKLQKGVNVKELIKKLEKDGNIEYAEPNFIYHTLKTPNDPSFNKLWGLIKIESEAAWDTSTGNRSVMVAVIDTGVDYNHEDLAGNIWENPNEIPNNGVDDDGNGFIDDIRGWDFINNDNDPIDGNTYGHGSHVAGTIGAVGSNGKGVVGVNWQISILPVKVLGDSGRGDSASVAAGIEYAANVGAKVINLSLGSFEYSSTIKSKVNYAYSKGVVVVAATGNCSSYGCNEYYCSQRHYPAAHEEVIAVANTTPNNQRNSCSSYYPEVELAAPGTSIYSTNPNNRYRDLSGTSMASPHVAGLAALIRSHNPALSNTEVRNILTTTAQDLGQAGRDKYYGYGLINARAALEGGEPPPPPEDPVCIFTAHPLQGAVPLEVDFNASDSFDPDGGSITNYAWLFGDDSTGEGITPSHTYTTVGDFTATIEVTDDEGATSTCSQDIKVLEKTIKYIETTGSIVYGAEESNLDQEAFDDREVGISSTTHHITLDDLVLNTTYYYKIKSGPSLWGGQPGSDEIVKNGAPFTFSTGPHLEEKENPDPVFGFVKDINGNKVNGALIRLQIKSDADTLSAPLSFITKLEEGWVIDLANSRTVDNLGYFSYEREEDELFIKVNAADQGSAEITVTIPALDSAAEDIILEPITPPETHKICQELSCVEVEGAGEDQCEDDPDCLVEKHFICQEDACVEVNGPGSNQCTSDPECQEPSPVIEELVPSKGQVGDPVAIIGNNFTSNGTVKFDNILAFINIYTDTAITTKVPEGLSPGEVFVTVSVGDKISNGVTFEVLPSPIQITNVSPPSGKNNEVVNLTISGVGFEEGATVILKSPDSETTIDGQTTDILDDTTITTTFNLNSLSAGTWHLRVTNPDEEYDEVPFVIVSPGTTLSFKIKFQGIKKDNGPNKTVTLSFLGTNLIDNEVETYATGDGIYQGAVDLGGIPKGSYDVEVKGPAHISETFQATIVAGEINYTNWTNKELKAGDINGDDMIESLDLAAVIRDFDLGKMVEEGTITDLNDDLMVEALDLALVIANFNLEQSNHD